jgi:hypothetical protein
MTDPISSRDAARSQRAVQQAQAQQQAQVTPTVTADDVAAPGDVVAAASANNERGRTATAALGRDVSAVRKEPALPEVKVPTAAELASASPTEPTPAHRAQATAFGERLAGIDAQEKDPRLQAEAMKAGNFALPNDQRATVLKEIATTAAGIADPAERDRFVRATAPDVGRAVATMALRSPGGAVSHLEAIGKGSSADTGRLLANETIKHGAFENVVPHGIPGTSVGNALVEHRSGRIASIAAGAGATAQAVIPGVDAAVKAANGDLGGAAASAAVDVAGGALLKGGKIAVAGAVGLGTLLAPTTAEAGPVGALIKSTMKFGDNVVEVAARKGLQQGRTATFDVAVTGSLKDGTKTTFRLVDERAKHNKLSTLADTNLDKLAKDVSRGKHPDLAITRTEAQFAGRFNTVEGQAQLANEVMKRVTPQQLAAVGTESGALTVQLPTSVGLTPIKGGQVVPATSVRVMRNNDGSFHLVPMP